MLKKTMLAILTIIALSATFAPMANAQRQCSHADREFYSAHAYFGGC
jgi:hypothetical protein